MAAEEKDDRITQQQITGWFIVIIMTLFNGLMELLLLWSNNVMDDGTPLVCWLNDICIVNIRVFPTVEVGDIGSYRQITGAPVLIYSLSSHWVEKCKNFKIDWKIKCPRHIFGTYLKIAKIPLNKALSLNMLSLRLIYFIQSANEVIFQWMRYFS